ncbi:MAG: lysoplasmalogenase [Chitinophagaceae bacterium]|jgi:uncharacterized membrane protein YhhN
MKKFHWIILFLLTLGIHLTGLQLDSVMLAGFTKALLLPILFFFFWHQTYGILNRSITVFGVAVVFSWLGDLLLMKGEDPQFFLLGLGSFLLAQVGYSYFFYRIMQKEKIRFGLLLVVPVLIYYATLITWLYPFLHSMLAPVSIYGAIISIMLLLALHTLYMPAVAAGRWFMGGAILFVASDSALAFNKFYAPFDAAPLVIMLTYGLAQLFLTLGAILYIKRERARHSLF